ncbi:MAG: glycosyltransferase family 4 protein [Pseudomonadota bacterium]
MQPSKRRTNVLIIVESVYPSVVGGGAEAQIETLTRNLPNDIRASVVAPLVPRFPQAIRNCVHGCEVYRIPYPNIRLIGGLVMLLRLVGVILARRHGIDAIYCHIIHNMAPVACAIGRMLGKPVIVKPTGKTELDQGILSNKSSPIVAVKRWLIKRATAIQAVSKAIEDALTTKGFDPARIHRIPNAVDMRVFAPAFDRQPELKAALGLEADFVACFVGRLAVEKALDTLIEAWARAIPREASAKLVLVGTGPLEDELKAQVRTSGLERQVVFAGFVEGKSTIATYWQISDVGLIPSEFEGLSNALLEAMASGVPMIGSRVSGNVDLIESRKTGWLFTPRDVDQLSACLSDAYTMDKDAHRAMGEASIAKAHATVGVDHIWRRLVSLCFGRPGVSEVLCAE